MINKSDMLQDIERVLVSEEEIHARIKEVGAQIADDYRGKCPILVGVLKGVVPFFAEMANAISIPVQEDFMCITSFEGGTESTGKLTFRKDIDHDIEGRHVLILEDIIDSGSTLKMICEMFHERKPASIKICTLLDKPTGRKVELKPDYTCFTVPPAFVVGFGLFHIKENLREPTAQNPADHSARCGPGAGACGTLFVPAYAKRQQACIF